MLLIFGKVYQYLLLEMELLFVIFGCHIRKIRFHIQFALPHYY